MNIIDFYAGNGNLKMDAGNHLWQAMASHFKNRAGLKIKMSRSYFKKVAIAVIAVLAVSAPSYAQEKGDIAVGAHIKYGVTVKVDGGTEIDEPNFGVGAKFQYSPLKRLRLEGAFTHFMPTDYTMQERMGTYDYNYNFIYNKWCFEACLHFLVGSENFIFYPTVGVVTVGRKLTAKVDQLDRQGKVLESAKDSESHNGIGMNFGTGFDIKVVNNIFVNTELKFQVASINQEFIDLTESLTLMWLSAGIKWKF